MQVLPEKVLQTEPIQRQTERHHTPRVGAKINRSGTENCRDKQTQLERPKLSFTTYQPTIQ